MLPQLIAIASAVTVSGCIALEVLTKKTNEKLYKSSKIFKEAMSTLRSSKYAVDLLGEPIEDGSLYTRTKTENNLEIYEVRVFVSGSKTKGNMYFWVNRKVDDPDSAYLNRIELQIMNMNKRLLVKKNDERSEQNHIVQNQSIT